MFRSDRRAPERPSRFEPVIDRSGRWVKLPVIEGALLVMMGDTMETWTNGRLCSPLHRVRNTGQRRTSFPFFQAADFDAKITPLPQCVPAGEIATYKPMIAGHHFLGQLVRDFPYLRRRYQEGKLPAGFIAPESNPFEDAKLAGLANPIRIMEELEHAIA